MKWQILSIGKPSLDYAKRGVDEYLKRLKRYTKCEMRQTRESGKEKNSEFLLNASEGAYRIVLDERGKSLTTRQFSDLVANWQMDGKKEIAILIGGADGHSEELREKADLTLSLGRFTIQHELALVVVLEQLYRAHTILNNEPYHRD